MRSERVMAFLLGALLLAGGCASGSSGKKDAAAPVPEKKLKAAFYVDEGSRSNGVFYWARLLSYSPGIEMTPVDGRDLREGKLKGFDLLVILGGSSAKQYRSMGEAGAEAVRKFVKEGGSYVGICAGFHCALNRKERIGLLPFEYQVGAGGAQAVLPVEISPRGGEILGIKPGRYRVRYSLGPISKPGAAWEHGKGEVLGVYKGTVSPSGRPGGNFFDAPAVIYGNYGKGKVIATSFHPESHVVNHALAMGCIYAATGLKTAPVFPKKNYRPVRVGFYTPGTIGKGPILRMLELDREPDLDVLFVSGSELNEGILEHLDVFVVPDGMDAAHKSLASGRKEMFARFLDRGGKLLVSGAEAAFFAPHKNFKVIPEGRSFVPEALARP
ncbi:MAG: hypothetical protein IJT50_11500 [Lentisphaeria bacterium]|nr:hypothetical protein [Lentisphaeria bacterium]